MTPATRPPRKDATGGHQPRRPQTAEQLAARRRTAAVATLIAGIVGIVLVAVGAVGGVNAALGGDSADVFVLLFVFGAVILVAAVVSSIIGLMSRSGNRVLWISALVVGVLPAAAVVVVNLTR